MRPSPGPGLKGLNGQTLIPERKVFIYNITGFYPCFSLHSARFLGRAFPPPLRGGKLRCLCIGYFPYRDHLGLLFWGESFEGSLVDIP